MQKIIVVIQLFMCMSALLMVLPKCRNNYSRPPPLKIPPPSVVQAVQGMSSIIKATYSGNYNDSNLLAFWCIAKQDGYYHCFFPTDNNTVYSVTTNGCVATNFDCCYFSVSIEIRSLSLNLSGAELSSMAGWNQLDPTYSVGNSTLIVNPYPTIEEIRPFSNNQPIGINEGQSAQLTCIYNASTNPNITITTWRFNRELLEKNSSHYTLITDYGNNPYRVLSKLIILNITLNNTGTYTCQCVYNSLVISDHSVVTSNTMNFRVEVMRGSGKGKESTPYS